MNTIIIRLFLFDDPSKSKTLSTLVSDPLISLRKRWTEEFGGDPTSTCLRSTEGEFYLKDDQPVGSLLIKEHNTLELSIEYLTPVVISIDGFPDFSNITLEIPLGAYVNDFTVILCSRLGLPHRNIKCQLESKILQPNVQLSEQGVLRGSEIVCDLQFHFLIECVSEPLTDPQTETYDVQCFGSDSITCLIPRGQASDTQYRLLLHFFPLSMDGSVADALRDHGGLRRWHWILQLEKQLSLEVLYLPPRGLARCHVWPTDQVHKLIDDNGASLLLEDRPLDPTSTFKEQKIVSNSRLWAAKTIKLKIENSNGVIRELQIPDSSSISMLRQQIASMESNQRFYIQYDNAWLVPETRLLYRCGVSDGAVIKLVRRQIPIILSYHGNHYSLGYVDSELSYDELLDLTSQVTGLTLDQETVFECATCKRTTSLETKAQRRLPEACCEVTPRLLRVHRPTEIKLQVVMSSDPVDKIDHDFSRSTSCSIHDMMAFVADQLQRQRDLAEDREDFGVPLSEVSDLHDCISLQVCASVNNSSQSESHYFSLKSGMKEEQELSRTTKRWWNILSWFRSHDSSDARKLHTVYTHSDDDTDLNRSYFNHKTLNDIEAPKHVRRKFSKKDAENEHKTNRRSRRFSVDEVEQPLFQETSMCESLDNQQKHAAGEGSCSLLDKDECISKYCDQRKCSVSENNDTGALDVTLSRDTKFITKYLHSGGNVNSLLSDGTSLLAVAAMYGNEESLSILLDAGAAVDGICKNGITSLHFAATGGHVNVLQRLLDAGASVDAKLKDGHTALVLAIRNRHLEVVEKLLARGANPNAALSNGITGLYIAAELDLLQIAKQLITYGADVNFARQTGATPLFISAQNGHTEMARFLFRNGGEIDRPMRNGATPLYIACQNGHWKMVCFLVNANANIEAAMENGATPLLSCAQNGQVEILTFLLRNNAQINASCVDGTTPLFVAAQNGHVEVSKRLIFSGADINKTCDNGASPLYISCQNGHEDVARLLLEQGADINAVCKDGSSAVYVAAQNGHTDIIQLLIEYNADVQRARKDKTTPFVIAHQQGHNEVLELLKDRRSLLPGCIQQ